MSGKNAAHMLGDLEHWHDAVYWWLLPIGCCCCGEMTVPSRQALFKALGGIPSSCLLLFVYFFFSFVCEALRITSQFLHPGPASCQHFSTAAFSTIPNVIWHYWPLTPILYSTGSAPLAWLSQSSITLWMSLLSQQSRAWVLVPSHLLGSSSPSPQAASLQASSIITAPSSYACLGLAHWSIFHSYPKHSPPWSSHFPFSWQCLP